MKTFSLRSDLRIMLIAKSKCLEATCPDPRSGIRAKLFFLCIAKATEIKKTEHSGPAARARYSTFNDLLVGIKIILKSLLLKKPFHFILSSLFLSSVLMLNPTNLCAQVKVVDDNRVGIGTDTPDPSAKLEIHSTNNPNNPTSFKGFLKPRMTYAQMLSIQNPANGLEVYVTDPDKRKTYWWDGYLQSWVTYHVNADPFDELQILLTNNQPGNISISDGNTITINVNDADADPNNELQVLSLNGNELTISDGNTVTLSGGTVSGNGTKDFVPKWGLDGTDLEDSQIYDDGNTVSIGSLQPVDASENIGLLLKGRLAFEFPDNTNFTESNIALGYKSGNISQTGNNNIFIGNLAGQNVSSGNHNTFLGSLAGNQNTEGHHNIFFGERAGYHNKIGFYNNYFGYLAGEGVVGNNNSNPYANNFFGPRAGRLNISGIHNNFFGANACHNNSYGSWNNFFGNSAGYKNETGLHNIAIGLSSGFHNKTGSKNIFIGHEAGYFETGSNRLYIAHSRTEYPLIYGEFDNNIVNINGSLTSNYFNTPIINASSLHASPTSPYYGYAIKIDDNYTGGWTRELSWMYGDDNKVASVGVHGNSNGASFMYFNPNQNGAQTGTMPSIIDPMMVLSREGNLGLSTDPTQRLDVEGNIRLRGGIADINNNLGSENQVITSDGNGGWSWQNVNNLVPDGESDRSTTLQNISQNKFTATLSHGGGSIDMHWTQNSTGAQIYTSDKVGIQRSPENNTLEVNGEASKSTAGEWLVNGDARLKKNITPLSPKKTLEQLLRLQGITYQWNDDKTGYDRPKDIQYGFTAQNIREVFPTLVSKDNQGYLQTAYGTYDAIYVEAIRALLHEITYLKMERKKDQEKISDLESNLQQLESIVMKLKELTYGRNKQK